LYSSNESSSNRAGTVSTRRLCVLRAEEDEEAAAEAEAEADEEEEAEAADAADEEEEADDSAELSSARAVITLRASASTICRFRKGCFSPAGRAAMANALLVASLAQAVARMAATLIGVKSVCAHLAATRSAKALLKRGFAPPLALKVAAAGSGETWPVSLFRAARLTDT
jgi:pyruvate/2-oxoglutarate dehydrogenase complex dihydrolipoamide acyltransferase (E2) component